MTRVGRGGMTLVEMLVVLAVVGVMTTAVALGGGFGDRGLSAQTEANRLAERIRFAQDEAIVTRRPLALDWDAHGYAFMTRAADGAWTADSHALLGPRHDLPGRIALAGDGPVLILIKGDGLGAPADLSLSDGDRTWRVAYDGLNVVSVSVEDGR